MHGVDEEPWCLVFFLTPASQQTNYCQVTFLSQKKCHLLEQDREEDFGVGKAKCAWEGRQTWVGILAEPLTSYRTWDKFPHLHHEDNNVYLTWETMQSTCGYKTASNIIIITLLVVTLGLQSRDARKHQPL